MQPKLTGEASEARDLCWHIRIQACPAAQWPQAPNSSIRLTSASLCQESPRLKRYSFPHIKIWKLSALIFFQGHKEVHLRQLQVMPWELTKSLNTQKAC